MFLFAYSPTGRVSTSAATGSQGSEWNNRASLGSRRRAPQSQQWVFYRTDNITIFCIIWRIRSGERETARWRRPSACMGIVSTCVRTHPNQDGWASQWSRGYCPCRHLVQKYRYKRVELYMKAEMHKSLKTDVDPMYSSTNASKSWWILLRYPGELTWNVANQNPPLLVPLQEWNEFIQTRSWVMRSELLLHPRLMMRRQV